MPGIKSGGLASEALTADETAELNRVMDAGAPGATPAALIQEFDPVYERSPERAVESLRRYTKDCEWVLSVDWVGEIVGIEVRLTRSVPSEFLLRLPNFVNGFSVNTYDEESALSLKSRSALIWIRKALSDL